MEGVVAVPHIRQAVERLAAARREAAARQAQVAQVEAEHREHYAALYETLRTAQEALTAADTEVRALTEAHFAATGDVRPAPGVSIAMEKVFTIDESAVLAFARRTGLGLVPESVDLKALRAMARNPLTPVEGITVTELGRARVAADLDKALAEVAA